jgi:glycosyltransferase involved in cell wall biosynthesis
MRVCFAVLHYDPRVASHDFEEYLDRLPIHRELPGEVATRGHEVHVVHLYPLRGQVSVNGARHYFEPPSPAFRLLPTTLGSRFRRDPAAYQPALQAVRRIQSIRPDVVHFHGLNLTWNLWLLTLLLDHQIPMVAHYHGGLPPRNELARWAIRSATRRISRFLFTTAEHANPFVAEVGLDPRKVVEFFETSTTIQTRDRVESRCQTGLVGDPVFLWTGRLHGVKDPLTALRGFEHIARVWSESRLYLYYLTDELLPQLRAFVAERPELASRVEFRGRVPWAELEAVYNSADFFLQASRREVNGYAPLEAMATGTVPVLTDIPSFRAMTEDGRYGVLFPPGDDVALARRVLEVRRADLPKFSCQVRQRFSTALSFPALAMSLEQVYDGLLGEPSVR